MSDLTSCQQRISISYTQSVLFPLSQKHYSAYLGPQGYHLNTKYHRFFSSCLWLCTYMYNYTVQKDDAGGSKGSRSITGSGEIVLRQAQF